VEVVQDAAEMEFDEDGYFTSFGAEDESQTVAAYSGTDDGYYRDE
jgi:hypothetical protein